MNNPLDLREYSRGHVIEQIMVLAGRSTASPVLYRKDLENKSTEELGAILDKLHEELENTHEN